MGLNKKILQEIKLKTIIMKTKTATQRNTLRLQSLLVAASIALPAGSLFAQDADKAKEQTTKDARAASATTENVEIFQGTLVDLHAYLSGASESDAPQIKTEAERNNAATSSRSSDRGWSRSMSNSAGPMGLIVNEEGLLGLGKDTTFYVLTYDPQNSTSREAYARTVKFSQTGDFLEGTDRDYVRSSADNAAGNQRDLAKKNAKADEPIRDDDRFVRVTGKIVKRGNVEAIVVHSISPASREFKPTVPNEDKDESLGDAISDVTQ